MLMKYRYHLHAEGAFAANGELLSPRIRALPSAGVANRFCLAPTWL
jgi:hypothetical protein